MLLAIVAGPFSVPTAGAADALFNPNLIITDDQLLDVNGMNQTNIQEFLNGHAGILKTYTATDTDGVVKPAAQIIYEAAQQAQISPRFLLVTLQKEESLIDDDTPSQIQLDWATGYGFCDSCTTTTPSIQQYKGFARQVRNAAQLVRRYLTNLGTIGITTAAISNTWGPGKTNNILCISSDASGGRNICVPGTTIAITPANNVTAILYTYTPHPGGNYSFWKLWNQYNFNLFRFYPDGSLLKAKNSNTTYLIQDGLKRQFSSANALAMAFNPKAVIAVSTDHLSQYQNGTPIIFPDDTLVAAPNRGVYLIVDGTKRAIQSRTALQMLTRGDRPIPKASWDQLNQIADGAKVTTDNAYSAGVLVQNNKTGAVFYVKNGLRQPIPGSAIYKSQFGNRKPIPLSPDTLATFQEGPYIHFKDGTLLVGKTGGTIFVIADGSRRPIANWATMKTYGYDTIWATRVSTDDRSVGIHPLGQILDANTSLVGIAGKP